MPILSEPAVVVKFPAGNSTRLAVECSEMRMYEARHEDDHYRLQAVIPLQDAIQFAVTLLEFVQATAHLTDEEAALLDWIRRETQRRDEAADARADAISAHWGHD